MNRETYNKKARHDYEIIDSIEAGIVLTGEEIKAFRAGRVNMTSSYAKIINGEVFWIGGMINGIAGDTQRTRKLLLNKDQIRSLIGKTQEKGLALLPLKIYLKKGRAKMELGLGRGMKKYDKRELLKKKDQAREAQRSTRDRG